MSRMAIAIARIIRSRMMRPKQGLPVPRSKIPPSAASTFGLVIAVVSSEDAAVVEAARSRWYSLTVMQIFSGAFGLGAAALGLATEAICLGAVLTTGRGVIPALAPVTIIFRVPFASGLLKSVLGMRATTGIS